MAAVQAEAVALQVVVANTTTEEATVDQDPETMADQDQEETVDQAQETTVEAMVDQVQEETVDQDPETMEEDHLVAVVVVAEIMVPTLPQVVVMDQILPQVVVMDQTLHQAEMDNAHPTTNQLVKVMSFKSMITI